MTRVLAVRTRDGHYLEFRSLRAKTDKGEIEIDIDACVIAEILDVEEPEQTASAERSQTLESLSLRCDDTDPDFRARCQKLRGHSGDHLHTSGADGRSVWWPQSNGKPALHRIDANGIDSREAFGQLGG